jgi:integrase
MGDRQEWAGGYKRWDGGRWTFYIRRRDARLGHDPDGRAKRREVCTGAQSEEVAHLHLTAFQKNPLAYESERVVVGRSPLPFTEALCIEYLKYLDTPQEKGGKGDCPNHCNNSRYALKWWRAQLGEVNFRALTVEDIRKHVPVVDEHDDCGVLRKAPKSRKLKIQVIKAFVSWLRKMRGSSITQGEGPDMSSLTVPQYRGRKLHDPAKALERRDKGKRAIDGYPLLREKLAAQKRWHWAMDALDMQADTGWHTTEIERWVKLGGMVEAMPEGREHEGTGVLVTIHKSGDEHQTPVGQFGYEAARRLMLWCAERGGKKHQGWNPVTKRTEEFEAKLFPRQQYERLCHRLCRKHKIPEFGPGHLRHAVATLNAGRGYATSIIGCFLGHSEAQQGELVRTTYADARAQLTVVKAVIKPVPARIMSPLDRLMQKVQQGGVPEAAANDNATNAASAATSRG